MLRNLENEIYFKGGRFVTSQILELRKYIVINNRKIRTDKKHLKLFTYGWVFLLIACLTRCCLLHVLLINMSQPINSTKVISNPCDHVMARQIMLLFSNTLFWPNYNLKILVQQRPKNLVFENKRVTIYKINIYETRETYGIPSPT